MLCRVPMHLPFLVLDQNYLMVALVHILVDLRILAPSSHSTSLPYCLLVLVHKIQHILDNKGRTIWCVICDIQPLLASMSTSLIILSIKSGSLVWFCGLSQFSIEESPTETKLITYNLYKPDSVNFNMISLGPASGTD